MSNKEDKAREYVDQKVKDKNLYPNVGFCRRKQLTTFKSSELEASFEAGYDAGKQEIEHIVWQVATANYEKGKKEFIDKACEWLIEHKEAVETEDNGIMGWIPDYFIEDFRRAMEE